MDDDKFNISVRKFLKIVGVTGQREIEKAVRAAMQNGSLQGSRTIEARMTLEVPALNLKHVVEEPIDLG
jgi:Family of unknown function (DUF6494)